MLLSNYYYLSLTNAAEKEAMRCAVSSCFTYSKFKHVNANIRKPDKK